MPPRPAVYLSSVGMKRDEHSNQRGNVMTVISDKIAPIDRTSDGLWDYFNPSLVSATDYYPFGMGMPGRLYSPTGYRYSFNSKEKDDEMSGNGNSVDFGDRMYDPRLGRWNKVDALQAKYPGYSPYHFGYCNPIITVDVDGKENIVVVGNQGYSPKSDKQGGKYRYGENRRHFLEAGLNEALRLKQDKTQGTEGTTLVIYKGNYSAKEIASYKQRAEKSGITVVEVSYANEITNYVNEKEAQGTEEGKESARSSDLITDFSYVGHGWTKALYTGYNAIENDADYDALYTSTFNTEAFDLKCGVNLNACASGYDVMDDFVNRLTGGEVTGYTTTIMWGEKGLGSNRPYDKWYYPPGDPRRESSDRPTVPEANRTRTEQGTRTE